MPVTLTQETPKRSLTRTHPGALSYYLILGSAVVLLVFGITMVMSASTVTSIKEGRTPYNDATRQMGFAAAALIPAYVLSRLSIPTLRKIAPFALLGSWAIGALIFTPLAVGKGGNVAWIRIPGLPFAIQPSEFIKLTLALFLASILAAHLRHLENWRHLVVPLGAVGVSMVLVLGGHDLGTALVIAVMVAAMLVCARLPKKWLGVLAILALGAVVYMVIDNPTRMARIIQFLPGMEHATEGTSDALGYQPRHGRWALGTGGVFGVGLGASREKWAYLPEAHNDYIFAIIGEELGLVGTSLVLVLFAVLAWGIFRLYRVLTDDFSRLLAAGLGTWIIGQAFMNIFVVLGLAPVIGVPLPLISSGGSSLVSTIMAIGVLLALARTEPGASVALAQSTSAVRRSLSVIGRRARRSS